MSPKMRPKINPRSKTNRHHPTEAKPKGRLQPLHPDEDGALDQPNPLKAERIQRAPGVGPARPPETQEDLDSTGPSGNGDAATRRDEPCSEEPR